jgi:hypothetical protein
MPVKRRSGPPGRPGVRGGRGIRRGGEGSGQGGGWGGSAGADGLPAGFAHGRSGRTPGRMWAEKKNEPSFSGKKNKEPEIPCVFSHLAVRARLAARASPRLLDIAPSGCLPSCCLGWLSPRGTTRLPSPYSGAGRAPHLPSAAPPVLVCLLARGTSYWGHPPRVERLEGLLGPGALASIGLIAVVVDLCYPPL